MEEMLFQRYSWNYQQPEQLTSAHTVQEFCVKTSVVRALTQNPLFEQHRKST